MRQSRRVKQGQRMTQTRANPIFWAALIAGVSFMVPVVCGWSGSAIVVWKGAGVAFLALWAAFNARGFDGWLLVLALAFGALGDVLLDAVALEVGAIAFVVGHVIAMVLYWRNHRAVQTGSQRALAIIIVPLTAFISWQLVRHVGGAAGVAVYGTIVALMAALAWTSRFPRYRTGIGAMAFVISDLLIFARLGGVVPAPIATALIWPLYFGGQTLIAWGVVTTLRHTAAR